jgi:hypothetical protein
MVVIDSYRGAPDTWTVDGVTGPGSNAATAFVYCRRNNHAISDVTGTAQVPAAENATGQANASCPGTTRLVGGGFQSTHGPSPADLAAVTTSLTGTSNRWTVAAFSSQGSAQTLTAHAYCMRGIPAPTTLSASVNTLLSNGVSATATSPSCPRARKAKPGKKRKKRPAQQLSGGGFFSPPVTTDMTHLITSSFASASGWATTELHATGTPSPAGLLSQGICV